MTGVDLVRGDDHGGAEIDVASGDSVEFLWNYESPHSSPKRQLSLEGG